MIPGIVVIPMIHSIIQSHKSDKSQFRQLKPKRTASGSDGLFLKKPVHQLLY